ncbi:MAG: monovalent cation/H(+) antiporter subunit G [Phycisphaerae bacterium]
MTAAIVGGVLMGIGAVFLLLGGLGILRFPDVYNRLQAGTKCTTLGAVCTIVGVGIAEPTWIFKAVLVAVFILLTNPISAHALARASRKSGVALWEKSLVDVQQVGEGAEEPGGEADEEAGGESGGSEVPS